MTFTEEWFSERSQFALVGLYAVVEELDGDVVEVGCWEGRSTCALANACHPAILHAVDTWEGSPGEVSEQLAKERDVFGQFSRNIEDCTDRNVQTHRQGWRDYFTANQRPVRFIHIDAEHTYDEVHDNIAAVLPLMVPGGVICGDDVHHPPIQRAVWDTLGNVGVVATLWHWTKP